MPLGFPSNPQVGDTYTLGNSTWVWNGTAWQLTSTVTSYDPFTVVRLIATTSTNSTGTDTGGVVVYGGVGIGKDLYVGGKAYASGSEVLTTATVNLYASQTAIFAGTDTAVNTSTGNVTIWNTSTLQSVTNRGASTNNAISITNTSQSTSTITGALKIVGGAGIGGNLYVGGLIYRDGISVGYGYTGSLGYTGSAGFTGSQGITGFSGSRGDTGYTGSQGALGYSGSKGDTGYTGSKGDVGFTGSGGPQGFTGSFGFTGSIGQQGPQGFTGSRGFTGSIGPQGPQGFTGSIGPQGPQGFTGSIGPQGPQGFTGSIGPQGPQGFTGSVGPQGPQGFTGSVGAQGPQGFTGSVGAQGPQGFTGSLGFTGSIGPQGPQGFTGSIGPQGPQGFTGSRGPSDAIKATNDTTSTTLYPVMVNAAGSDQVPKVTTSKLYFNANTGVLTIVGEIIADKLTIQYTTVTTTLVQTDDIIQTLNTTQSTSTSTGALIIAGGAGIGSNLFVGGAVDIKGYTKIDELRFQNSYAQKFNSHYTFNTYLNTGEIQKILQIIPSGASQNYSIYGKIWAQSGDNTQCIDIEVHLRSNTLPDLSWEIYYSDALNGITSPYVKPVLWAKETTTATFILGIEGLTNSIHMATIDLMVVNRGAYYGNVTLLTAAEVASVDSGYTSYDFTLRERFTGSTDKKITLTTDSTSTTTGALVVNGGVGIQKNLYVGGTIYGVINGSISTATNSANVAIANDTASTSAHYVTFVSTSSGVAPIKTAATSGLVYFPSTGNMAIANSTSTDSSGYGGSVLDIKGPIYVRQWNSTVNYLGLGVNLSNTYINAEGVSNKLIIRVSGSERARITANGNMGLGTTAPDTITNTGSPHFVVKGLGDLLIAQATTSTNGEVAIGPDYIYQNQNQSLRIGTNNSQKAVFLNDGKFGLGVTTPRVQVDLGSANNVGQVLLIGETAANNRVGLGLDSATAGMRIFTVNTNTSFIELGAISSADGSTWTRNHSFGIAGKNSWINEQGGNFGINVTGPTERLEVSGNALIFGTAGAVGTGLAYYLGPSNNSRDLSFTRVAAGTLGIGRYVSGAWSESIRVTNQANVGIATTTPGAGLDVAKVDIRYGVNGGPGIMQVYEAESASISKTGGTVSADATASGGQVWGTNQNFQIYGPYINLPIGNYRLIARVKVADASYTGNAVRMLAYIGTSYTTKDRYIRGTDFRANNVWETFSVPFTIDATTTSGVEYYVFGLNSQQIYVDYIMVVNDTDSYSDRIWGNERVDGNLGINVDPLYRFHLSNSGATTQAFYADVGNRASTQTLFEHTGANTPVPFAISKSGYTGNSQNYGILYLDMAHNTVGGGSNLHFTLRDGANSTVEYGGIGAYIVANGAGAMNGNLALYTTSAGSTRQQRVTVRYDGNVGIAQTNPTYKLEVNGSFAATTKSFVIDHPTKDGMKLRYGSLEGPENGVYIRGRLRGTDTIILPDYWTKLVDPESITVMLTPMTKYQKLFVKEVVNNTVIIGNDNLLRKEIDCFYVVYGERADVEKLIVEVPINN